VKRSLTSFVAVVTLAFLASPHSALACSACYGASDSPLAQGMNMGILFLLGVIGSVLAAITAFFIFVARNSARLAAAAAQSQIQTDKQS
jgi:hypothetical protein